MVDTDYPLSFSGTTVMRARIDASDGVVTVALVGEFDVAAKDSFTTLLTDIETTKPRAIVADLRGLTFIDSSGLRSLLNAHERAKGSHAFAVLNGSGPAHRILAMTGIEEQPFIFASSQELRDGLADQTV